RLYSQGPMCGVSVKPLSVALVLLSLMGAVHFLLARTMWAQVTSIRAKAPAILSILLLLAIGSWPLFMISLGLIEEQIECLGRSCHGQIYTRALSPIAYWLQLTLLFIPGSVLLSGAVRISWILVAQWGETPNRLPFAQF